MFGSHATRLIVLSAVLAGSGGCTGMFKQKVQTPSTAQQLGSLQLESRELRLSSTAGEVTIRVENVAFPFLSGMILDGDGSIQVDTRAVVAAEVARTTTAGLPVFEPVELPSLSGDIVALAPFVLRLHTADGHLSIQHVSRVDGVWLQGRRIDGVGRARVDIRAIHTLAQVHPTGSARSPTAENAVKVMLVGVVAVTVWVSVKLLLLLF